MNTSMQLVFGRTKPNLRGRTAYLRLPFRGLDNWCELLIQAEMGYSPHRGEQISFPALDSKNCSTPPFGHNQSRLLKLLDAINLGIFYPRTRLFFFVCFWFLPPSPSPRHTNLTTTALDVINVHQQGVFAYLVE